MGLEIQGYSAIYRTTALAASGIIHAGTGRFIGLIGYNSNVGAQFIQVFKGSATVPADATVPDWCFKADGSSNFQLDLYEILEDYATGLTWSNSSTVATKTIGAADCWVQALYLPRQ